jgi:hypothetical protein
MNNAATLFDQLSDEELIKVGQHHADRFNRAWGTVMRTHYKSGQHIDAHDTMDRQYEVLGVLSRYVRTHRPAGLYEDFCAAINWKG